MIYTCGHLNQHRGELSDSPYEVAWRRHLLEYGWVWAGYCYLYYPPYVRHNWATLYAPTYGEGI